MTTTIQLDEGQTVKVRESAAEVTDLVNAARGEDLDAVPLTRPTGGGREVGVLVSKMVWWS